MVDDDPKAIAGMLQFVYGKDILYPTKDASPENVIFCIGLLRVADKYFYPTLESKAPTMFGKQLFDLLDSMAEQHHQQAVDDLCKVVKAVYDFEGDSQDESTSTRGPITDALVTAIFSHPFTDPMGAAKKLTEVINDTVGKHAELGRDLFYEMTRQRSTVDEETGKSYFALQFKVKCTNARCGKEWMLPSENGRVGYCWMCGDPGGEWHEEIVD